MDLNPTPDTLRAFFAMARASWVVGYDTEALGRDSMRAPMDRISFATAPIDGPCWVCDGTGKLGVFDCDACKGAGSGLTRRAVCIPLIHADTGVPYGTSASRRALLDIVAREFSDETRIFAGQYAGIFDEPLVARPEHVGCAPKRLIDTQPLAKLRAPGTSTALGALGMRYLDIWDWKNNLDGSPIAAAGSSDEHTRSVYCCRDSQVVVDVLPQLMADVRARGQAHDLPAALKPAGWPSTIPWTLYGTERWTQKMCVGLKRNGIRIDPARQHAHAVRLQAESEKWRERAADIAASVGVYGPVKSKKRGAEPFNPNSTHQLGRALYDRLGMVPIELTESGGRSTRAACLRTHLADATTPDAGVKLIEAVFKARRATKSLGTFVDPLVPEDMRLLDRWYRDGIENPEDLEWLDADGADEELERFDRGLVQADGKIHADWHNLPVVGRLGCRRNNQQNVPWAYRDQYVPDAGMCFVGADLSQCHPRIMAEKWRIPTLLECYTQGLNPYSVYASRIFFNERYRNGDGWGPDGFDERKKPKRAKGDTIDPLTVKLYKATKTLILGGAYGAGPETLLEQLHKIEDDDGNLLFIDWDLAYVAGLHDRWMGAEPEWAAAHAACMAEWRKTGQVADYLFGRSSQLLDKDPSSRIAVEPAAPNFKVFAAEPAIMRLCEADAIAAIPFEYAGPGTGLVNHMHDSLTFQVRLADREWALGVVREAMTRTLPGWSIPVECEPSWGMSLQEA